MSATPPFEDWLSSEIGAKRGKLSESASPVGVHGCHDTDPPVKTSLLMTNASGVGVRGDHWLQSRPAALGLLELRPEYLHSRQSSGARCSGQAHSSPATRHPRAHLMPRLVAG